MVVFTSLFFSTGPGAKREAQKKRFNLALYSEVKGERQKEQLRSGFEAMDFVRYIQYMTTEIPKQEQLSEDEAIQAWQRDTALLEKESFEVRNPRSGQWEQRDHLWVPLKARRKDKVQESFQEKSSNKGLQVENPDNNALVFWTKIKFWLVVWCAVDTV